VEVVEEQGEGGGDGNEGNQVVNQINPGEHLFFKNKCFLDLYTLKQIQVPWRA
jgi:hypothetical protein